MQLNSMLDRIVGKYRRYVSAQYCRRDVELKIDTPIISFSFDDAPLTAFNMGGEILNALDARATYFVSLGLLAKASRSGIIASSNDLLRAVAAGHELGCHTYDHMDAWKTSAEDIERSVYANQRALSDIIPEVSFRTFAYPINEPKPATKRRLEKHFICCRGGGLTFNAGTIDLNLLKAIFLDKRRERKSDDIKTLIDLNAAHRGWLIFATHDVADNPSPYGCTPEYFREVVAYATRSGASILTIAKAFEKIRSSS